MPDLGGGNRFRRRPGSLCSTLLNFLLILFCHSPSIPSQGYLGDSISSARARHAPPLISSTFSTVMALGRSHLTEACGRVTRTRSPIFSPTSSNKVLFSPLDGDGKGPALVLVNPPCSGTLYQRLIPSSSRKLNRLDAANLYGGCESIHHTGLCSPFTPEIHVTVLLCNKASSPHKCLSSTVKELISHSGSRMVIEDPKGRCLGACRRATVLLRRVEPLDHVRTRLAAVSRKRKMKLNLMVKMGQQPNTSPQVSPLNNYAKLLSKLMGLGFNYLNIIVNSNIHCVVRVSISFKCFPSDAYLVSSFLQNIRSSETFCTVTVG